MNVRFFSLNRCGAVDGGGVESDLPARGRRLLLPPVSRKRRNNNLSAAPGAGLRVSLDTPPRGSPLPRQTTPPPYARRRLVRVKGAFLTLGIPTRSAGPRVVFVCGVGKVQGSPKSGRRTGVFFFFLRTFFFNVKTCKYVGFLRIYEFAYGA